jgi:hypothetical protein
VSIRRDQTLLSWRPAHAYVPGISERHAEQLFDPIKEHAPDAISFETLEDCLLYKLGLCFAMEGFYWESHELLEPLWLTAKSSSSEKLHLQALIQLANTGLKHRMARANAVQRLKDMAKELHFEALSVGAMPKYAISNFEKLQVQLLKEDQNYVL